ncbi:MAG: type II toxin-antitoxin system RelE/ParE family toxin [Candidatus Kerfeldbacteria bacterium]|nr:type II toxin-antitoxin system RelE/ParE family toxin [Candidatus Kerfeldbacteria bacterium]
MEPVLVNVTSEFTKSFRKLPNNIQLQAIRKDTLFRTNVFYPSLKTHKLKGDLTGFWSYSVNYSYRILFRFVNDHEVLYYDIGTHSIYAD